MMDYAELHMRSAFSFLRGASQPEALAGVMGLPGTETLQLITRMESQGLLSSRNGGLHLTPAGCLLSEGDYQPLQQELQIL